MLLTANLGVYSYRFSCEEIAELGPTMRNGFPNCHRTYLVLHQESPLSCEMQSALTYEVTDLFSVWPPNNKIIIFSTAP